MIEYLGLFMDGGMAILPSGSVVLDLNRGNRSLQRVIIQVYLYFKALVIEASHLLVVIVLRELI